MENVSGSKKKTRTSAFTLIELLVVSAIAATMFTLILGVFQLVQDGYITNVAAIEAHSDARLAFQWMTRDIKWAKETLATVTISGTAYATSANELVLSIPAIDAGGDIIDGVFDTVVYTLDGTDLKRLVAPDAASSRMSRDEVVANNISLIQFTVNADNISILLQTQITVFSGRILNNSLITTVSFRN